jgi:polyisoprenoid-binding protein YceI
MKKIFLALVFTVCVVNAFAQAIMPASSKVGFVIKNLGISVDGSLTGLAGTVKFNPKELDKAAFDVTVDAATLSTKNDMRDKHLKNDDYFNVEKFKTIRLVSNKITSKGGNNYTFTGVLTIRDKSLNVIFDFTAVPEAGGYRYASVFSIDRRKFGVGGKSLTLTDLVKVQLNVLAK